MFVVFVVVF